MATTIVLILVFAMAMPTFAGQSTSNDDKELTGSHYQINIIGVQNPKTADMDNSNGRTIFVPLEGSANIYL